MSHLQGKLEAAMIKANREAQAKTVPWWHGPGPQCLRVLDKSRGMDNYLITAEFIDRYSKSSNHFDIFHLKF